MHLSGAYFLTKSLHSTVKKYTSMVNHMQVYTGLKAHTDACFSNGLSLGFSDVPTAVLFSSIIIVVCINKG